MLCMELDFPHITILWGFEYLKLVITLKNKYPCCFLFQKIKSNHSYHNFSRNYIYRTFLTNDKFKENRHIEGFSEHFKGLIITL